MLDSNKRYLWAGGISCVLLSLSFFITSQIGSNNELDKTELSSNTYIAFFLSVAVIYTLSFALWRYFYSIFGFHRKRQDAFLDMGLMTIGKYMPGKIWGILFRGSIDNGKFNLDKNRVLVSFLEQGFTLLVGITFVAMLLLSNQHLDSTIAFIVAIIVTVLIGVAFLPALKRCLGFFKRIEADLAVPTLLVRIKLGGGYTLLWIISAAPIVILMQPTLSLSLTDTLSLIAVFLASMIAGWLAIVAPGGIGVRESVFVFLAPDFLTWQESLYWIAMHRSLYTLFDLVYGCLALGLIATRTRSVATR